MNLMYEAAIYDMPSGAGMPGCKVQETTGARPDSNWSRQKVRECEEVIAYLTQHTNQRSVVQLPFAVLVNLL